MTSQDKQAQEALRYEDFDRIYREIWTSFPHNTRLWRFAEAIFALSQGTRQAEPVALTDEQIIAAARTAKAAHWNLTDAGCVLIGRAVLAAASAPALQAPTHERAAPAPEPAEEYSLSWIEHEAESLSRSQPVAAEGVTESERAINKATVSGLMRVIEALQTDAARLNWLDDTNKRFRMGWEVGVAPAGNCSVRSIIMGGKPIREAIDAALSGSAESKKGE